jgi:hypothetical protein
MVEQISDGAISRNYARRSPHQHNSVGIQKASPVDLIQRSPSHGACALITTSNGKRVMIDCGHNAATNWRPGSALVAAGIHWLDRLYVTNFDEDHVSGYPNLMDNVRIGALYRNPSVAPSIIRHLKTEDGMGVGIERLVLSMEHVFTGGRPPAIEDYGDTSLSVYWNNYGFLGGFTDENNLSLVVFVTCGQHKFIFPGDVEREGWLQLLWNPSFVAELRGVNVFVASHHGRENGYCEEVLDLCPGIGQNDKHIWKSCKGDYEKPTLPCRCYGAGRRWLQSRACAGGWQIKRSPHREGRREQDGLDPHDAGHVDRVSSNGKR